MGKRLSRMRLPLVTAAMLLFAVLSGFTPAASAALPTLTQIRVALFIQARGSVPYVTLSSQSGLSVSGDRAVGSAQPWFSVGTDQSVKFQSDAYTVQAAAGTSLEAAKTTLSKLQSAGYGGSIFADSNGTYEVDSGSYATSDTAAGAKAKLAASLGTAPSIAGPLHLLAGTYGDASSAAAQVNALGQKGLQAFLVYADGANGKLSYQAWIGEAADQAGLQALENEVRSKDPGLQVTPAPAAGAYLLVRNDVTDGGGVTGHLFFNPAGQKIWVTSPTPGIKVNERYGRSYRGGMEISEYKNQLALINELPFEQYLYSVVGSEMSPSWPIQALEAQAVTARTYALSVGNEYGIAQISDTTYDQAYDGMAQETASTQQAVDATHSEVLVDGSGKLITPFYTSNAGGLTADPTEIWGGGQSYLKSVPSPDEAAAAGKLPWYRVVTQDGTVGYIRSDFAADTGTKNAAGLPVYTCNANGVNLRAAPYVDNSGNPPIAQLNQGDRFVVFDQAVESNAYQWIRGPWKPDVLLGSLNRVLDTPIPGTLQSVEVASRGPSGRIISLKVNGRIIQLTHPDSFRSALNDLPSTRFNLENTADATILNGSGVTRRLPVSAGAPSVLSGGTQPAGQLNGPNYFILDANGQVRAATTAPTYRFEGYGYGHGAGMSQWGAKAWADLGYDYKRILQYYYQNVAIVKD